MSRIVTVTPTMPQFDFLTSEARFPAMVAGFGAGKTAALIRRAIISKFKYPKLDHGFYEPTYDLVRVIAFPRFEEALSEMNIPYRLFKSPLNYIEFEGAGKIIFRSMDTPRRIIGYEHADANIDELDTLKAKDAEDVFKMIMARNRQVKLDGRPNTIGVGTTPEGFRFVYKRWHNSKDPDYKIIKAPTYSNKHLPADYVDDLRKTFPEKQLAAYIDGNFVNLTTGTVYYAYNRVENDSKEVVNGSEPLEIGMDFNVHNMAASIAVDRAGDIHLVDEIKGLADTPAMIKEIRRRYPDNYVVVYPDASGANTTSKNASESDTNLLKQAGFRIRVNSKNPAVKDRVLSANAAFEHKKVFVNVVKCPTIASSLEQQPYNESGEPCKKSGHDHQNDATTYLICYKLPIKKRGWK